MPRLSTENRARLRKTLTESFNGEEFRVLCFDLGVDFDSLIGESINTKAASMIMYFEQNDIIEKLFYECAFRRPTVAWNEMLKIATNIERVEKRKIRLVLEDAQQEIDIQITLRKDELVEAQKLIQLLNHFLERALVRSEVSDVH